MSNVLQMLKEICFNSKETGPKSMLCPKHWFRNTSAIFLLKCNGICLRNNFPLAANTLASINLPCFWSTKSTFPLWFRSSMATIVHSVIVPTGAVCWTHWSWLEARRGLFLCLVAGECQSHTDWVLDHRSWPAPKAHTIPCGSWSATVLQIQVHICLSCCGGFRLSKHRIPTTIYWYY